MKTKIYINVAAVLLLAFCAHAQMNNPRAKLLRSASDVSLVSTARNHNWSINFTDNTADTINIIALRVEFKDSASTLTTGTGIFGMHGDSRELQYYANGTYKFDALPHDSAYFANQLTALKNYYNKVSNGNLILEYNIYPSGSGEIGYRLANPMTYYSPGWKRRDESIDKYWDRKTHGLMMFVRDALRKADEDPSTSPFRNLYRDENGILREATTERKTVVLIFRAGASYMTDGGMDGYPNSPSDMIDAFINRDFFRYFKDTLELADAGVTLVGHGGQAFTIDEVMMSAETSNQDGLNWGIQGILVNQMARQLGIPDLFSTSSGVSAIGAFCIMDFAGYSAGQGFIPPYPSAWVRAFMGWDKPVAIGTGNGHRVKAISQKFESDVMQMFNGDTTILLVPINNNEYYLIENRQRNLGGVRERFQYDNDGLISGYPLNVNIEANARRLSTHSNVILETHNNDISLPASGVLVWHVDERIIRERLALNFINDDSTYRGVRLVEADGINDLGVTFVDAFYQAVFDHGGAEDVFPHKAERENRNVSEVNGFGPFSRPSTRANDGGHTYLKIDVSAGGSPRTEQTRNFRNDVITNFSDSVFLIDVSHEHIAQGWPRRAAPEPALHGTGNVPVYFRDPLVTPIRRSSSSNVLDTVLVVLSELGKLYLYNINDNANVESYGDRIVNINSVDYHGKPAGEPISIRYFDDIAGTFTFPSAIDNRVFVPSSHGNTHELHIYNSLEIGDKDVLTLPAAPSSYVSGISIAQWAIGLANGRVVIGSGGDITDSIQLSSSSEVNAIAALKNSGGEFTVIQNDGTLTIINNSQVADYTTVPNGIAPFTLATGNLDNSTDGSSEIVVSDSRQGVWVFTENLKLAEGWSETPNDWANAYRTNPQERDRHNFTQNFSAPALVDLNRNGNLDIIISGTNGVYALNRRGALLSRWPAYLDNRYWYQRGSVTTSPIAVSTNSNEPLILFSSPTGERATFTVTKIETADKERRVITYRTENGTLDSLWDLTIGFIDTVLTIGDSLIYPYVMPGGFVDALNASAARPLERNASWQWPVPQSRWPLSTGAPAATSPVAWRTSAAAIPDIFAVASDGTIYKWKLNGMVSDSLYWSQTGFDAARSFAYGGPRTSAEEIENSRQRTPIVFWNYPNPTSKDDTHTTFKYQFSGAAQNVRLDIHTITGRPVDSFRNLSGDFPDWNEFRVPLAKYGPGIYRVRMEATINGRKHSRFWKMAVVK